ncbi:MAG: WxcM-like domain-containing protein [Bacteroidales bacterium]|nr:WxcM-like domain-containing protein [Bacteroidales bacterium]MDE6231323.1 FdtA/QdtA family cupin domain-containing protein [Muribaculaceae bacterium]
MKPVWQLIQLPVFFDSRGNVSVIEALDDFPFEIARCHWIYDVPGGGARDGHAFRRNTELIIALSGSFDIFLDNGIHHQTLSLNRSYTAVLVPPGVWRELTNFSTNAVALILSSIAYDPEDYISDYDAFSKLRR